MKSAKIIFVGVLIIVSFLAGVYVGVEEDVTNTHLTEVCEACDESLASVKEHVEHRSNTHLIHECDVCGERFAERSQLEWHIKDKHKSMFQCRLCDKWFNSMTELDNHMGSKHKHYECPHCGHDTYFASRDELNKHIMVKHRSDER